MIDHKLKFICSQCQYTTYNRRYPKCERCGASLAEELLYSKEQINDADVEMDILNARIKQRKKPLAQWIVESMRGRDYWLDPDPT